ncbi:MAG: PTS N-acetylgalactosamine transporter subunit IIB [Cellulosilyticaceae bacterium]
MPNIVLTRIDNRLIHGQVATMWASSVGANLLLVANDNVCKDDFRQSLMDMCAPSFAQTRYFSLEKTINVIHKASSTQMIAIICETPSDVLALVEGGVPIKKVNIGNMHMADGKKQVSKAVCVDAVDVAAFKKLQELGVALEIRRVPSEGTEDVSKLFE